MTHTRTYEVRIILEAGTEGQLPFLEELIADLPDMILDGYQRPSGLKATCASSSAQGLDDQA